LAARDDVIKGRFLGRKVAAAILAFKSIAGEDVRPAEWGRFAPDLNEFKESNDGGGFDN
jgi:hypothetical protein